MANIGSGSVLNLNQCWPNINATCWHLAEVNFTETDLDVIHYISENSFTFAICDGVIMCLSNVVIAQGLIHYKIIMVKRSVTREMTYQWFYIITELSHLSLESGICFGNMIYNSPTAHKQSRMPIMTRFPDSLYASLRPIELARKEIIIQWRYKIIFASQGISEFVNLFLCTPFRHIHYIGRNGRNDP